MITSLTNLSLETKKQKKLKCLSLYLRNYIDGFEYHSHMVILDFTSNFCIPLLNFCLKLENKETKANVWLFIHNDKLVFVVLSGIE